MNSQIISACAENQWSQEVAPLRQETLFSAPYHRVSQTLWGGQAFLAVVREGGESLAWPYILHEIPAFPGYYDINSALGFNGPIANTDSPAFLRSAFRLLLETWRRSHVVSLFTRFSPFLANHELVRQWLIADPQVRGELISSGHIVVIESENYRAGFRESLRRDIRKARERGFATVHDSHWARLDDFLAIYGGVGERNHFAARHRMTREQIEALRDTLGSNAVLFHALDGPIVAASILGVISGNVLHAFFGGPHPDYIRHGAYKLLLDFIADWSSKHGLRQVNIGGGRAGDDSDSLYIFKTAFSRTRLPFHVGRLVVDPEAYDEFSRASSAAESNFFPAYRFAK